MHSRKCLLRISSWRRNALLLAYLCLALIGIPKPLLAQHDTGAIAGTVTDPAGALVPGAKIVATEVDKTLKYQAQTNAAGEYVISALPIGRYTVLIEKDGFDAAQAGPFAVNLQEQIAVNVKLTVGSLQQLVQVSGVSPQLETLTSDLGQVITSEQMTSLPLNGRNFAQLALLSVGTSPAEPGGRNAATFGFSSNGSRSYQDNFILDGVDNNSNLADMFNGTSYVIQPSVDAIQEFKVQTNAYSAEFSRGNGAVVNVSIKSGTNALHGAAWEFFRNDALDASNYFATTKPEFRQNQFGGALGGPVFLPHIYDGKNRTFFFVDYEGLRIREGLTYTGVVPTVAQRSGDFSQLISYSSPAPVLDCNGVATYPGEIFNTRLTQSNANSPTGLCGVPFGYANGMPSNIIPSSLFDPAAVNVAKLWGAPNVSGLGFNFISQPVQSTSQNNVDVRVDQHFSDQDGGFVRYSYESQPSTIPTIFQATGGYGPNFYAGIQDFKYFSVAVGETHTFSPTSVNELRLGFNHINARRSPWGYQQDLTSQLGIPGITYIPGAGGLPEFDFSGYSGTGDHSDLPTIEKQGTLDVSDTFTRVFKRSTLKVGGDILPELIEISQPTAPRGDFGFNSQFTDNPADPGTGGDTVASLLLGIATSTQITDIINIAYQRLVGGIFAEDDFRPTPHLTLNLGLRWDYFGNVQEKHDNMGNFDIDTGTMFVPKGKNVQLPESLTSYITLSATGSRSLVPQRLNSWSPRIGMAYQLNKDLVFRAGYGIFYSGYENGPWSNPSPGYNPPFYASQFFNPTCSAPAANPALGGQNCAPVTSQLSAGLPADALSNPNTPSLTELNPQMQLPYVQQWHATYEYQLPANMLLEFGYSGARGTHLYAFFNGNQATPSSDPSAPTAPRRPYPLIDGGVNELSTQGFSSYNGLQVRVEKRMSHGLSFLGSYEWQHALDNASSANLGSNNNSNPRFFRADPALDYGNADFDVRHRFVYSYNYQLPVGHGQAFGGSLPAFANEILGGWQLSGVVTLQTGNWYTITDGDSNFANSDGTQHPDLVGNANSKPCIPGTLFNTCAFADPALGSLGDAGRNIVRQPGTVAWDNALLKDFPITEAVRLQFRAEFFNLMNHPNLTTGNLDLDDSNIGYPSAASTPRQIQFALKLVF
jgi:hypothetical protein